MSLTHFIETSHRSIKEALEPKKDVINQKEDFWKSKFQANQCTYRLVKLIINCISKALTEESFEETSQGNEGSFPITSKMAEVY